jgi:hypothetical protein
LLLFKSTSCSILLNYYYYEDVDHHRHTWDCLHYFPAGVVVVGCDFVDAGSIVDAEDKWYYHTINDMDDEVAYADGVAFVL